MARVRPLVLLSERAKYTSLRPTHRRPSDATDAAAGYPVVGFEPVRPKARQGKRIGEAAPGIRRPILDRNPTPICDTCASRQVRRTERRKRTTVYPVNRFLELKVVAKVRTKVWVCLFCEQVEQRLRLQLPVPALGGAA